MPAPRASSIAFSRAADAVGQRARVRRSPDRLQLGGQRSQPAQVLAGTIAAHRFHRWPRSRPGRRKPRRYARRSTSIPRRRPRPGSCADRRAGRAGGAVLGPLNRTRAITDDLERLSSAASIPVGFFPEPCARSALPPPRPSTATASCLTRSLARIPRSWAADWPDRIRHSFRPRQ